MRGTPYLKDIRVSGMVLLMSLLAGATVALGDTITVTTGVDDLTNNGNCTLREAVFAAATNAPRDLCPAGGANPVIMLPAGTYTLSIPGRGENGASTGDLDVTGPLTIMGAGAATTIIDGATVDRVFDVFGGTVTITGVTIRNGQEGTTGCGCGAGVNIRFGTLVLMDSAIVGNSADGGAGIDVESGTTLQASGVTISGNTAVAGSDGAGIRNEGGTVTLVNVTVSGNLAQGNGGGISNNASGNTSLNGCTIANNTADSDGSGTGDGGGIFNAGTLTLSNTIIAGNMDTGNEAPDCSGTLSSQGYNLLANTTACTLSGILTGNVTDQPAGLMPLTDNGGPTLTQAISGTSPALDAGNPAAPGSGASTCPTTDQRGTSRPQGAACDIGAFELVGSVTTTTISSTTTTTLAGCTHVPTYPSVNCRLTDLAGATSADVPAGRLQKKLGRSVTKAMHRVAKAETLSGKGKTKGASRALGKAIAALGAYGHALDSHAAQKLDANVKDALNARLADLSIDLLTLQGT
jgi:CSLREA domain-containing protein